MYVIKLIPLILGGSGYGGGGGGGAGGNPVYLYQQQTTASSGGLGGGALLGGLGALLPLLALLPLGLLALALPTITMINPPNGMQPRTGLFMDKILLSLVLGGHKKRST